MRFFRENLNLSKQIHVNKTQRNLAPDPSQIIKNLGNSLLELRHEKVEKTLIV